MVHLSNTPTSDPDRTSIENLDMDIITSDLEVGTIELNAPVPLISESYHKYMAKHLADEMNLVNEP